MITRGKGENTVGKKEKREQETISREMGEYQTSKTSKEESREPPSAYDRAQDRWDEDQDEKVSRLEQLVLRLTESLERVQFFDYIEHLNKPRRIIWNSFMGGISRGLGMAIGFTLLGALLMALLTWMANTNLPIIGKFVAEIVKMVELYNNQ